MNGKDVLATLETITRQTDPFDIDQLKTIFDWAIGHTRRDVSEEDIQEAIGSAVRLYSSEF